jgi:hypothetical protein
MTDLPVEHRHLDTEQTDPRVAAARDQLELAQQADPSDQVEIFERVHNLLRSALDEPDRRDES